MAAPTTPPSTAPSPAASSTPVDSSVSAGRSTGQEPGARRQAPSPRDPRLRQARSLIQAGRLEQARELLDRVLDERPDHSEARLLAGRVAIGLGDLDGAESHLLTARDNQPRFPFMIHQALGMLELQRRDFQGALTRFGNALEAAPAFAPARLARARTALFLGDVQAARGDLERVASEGEGSTAAEAVVLLGELDLLQGRGGDAVSRFRTVAGEPGSEEGPAPARMYLLTLAGSPAESEPRVRAWLGDHLNDPHAWFWFGMVKAAAGDRDGARRSLSVALAIDDQHAPSYLVLRDLVDSGAGGGTSSAVGDGTVLPLPYPRLSFEMATARRALSEEDPELAEETAAEILEVRPRFVPARLVRLRAAEIRGDLLGALLRLDEILETTPPLTSLLVHRARLARRVGALDLAEEAARSALELRPEDGSLHFLLGSILADAGRNDEAIGSLERAVDLGYRTAGLYITLGNVHHERQEIGAAVDAMQKAVELDPEAAGQIAGFALTALTAEDAETVRGILEDHLERDPDDMDALYTVGSLYLRQGELERAEEAFTRLEELAPGRSRVHYNLALIHRRRGDEAAAEREMARFRELKAEEDERWEAHNEVYRLRQRARDALEGGEPERAVASLKELLAGDLSEPGDRVLLGKALLATGDDASALREFRRALEELPHDPRALCGAATAAASVGEDASRVTELERRARLLLGHSCPPEEGQIDDDTAPPRS